MRRSSGANCVEPEIQRKVLNPGDTLFARKAAKKPHIKLALIAPNPATPYRQKVTLRLNLDCAKSRNAMPPKKPHHT